MSPSALYSKPALRWKAVNWKLGLKLDGGNGSTTYTDSSPAGRTVSSLNSGAQSSSAPMRGSSGFTGGGTTGVQVTHDNSLNPGTSEFIVDLLLYIPTAPVTTDGWAITKTSGAGFTAYNVAWIISSAKAYVGGYDSVNALAYEFNIPLARAVIGKVFRLTVSRCGAFVYCFVNGKLFSRVALATTVSLHSNSNNVYVGNISTGIRPWQGSVDEVNIVIGEGCNYEFDPWLFGGAS